MLILQNATLAQNGRIISNSSPYNSIKNRGIRTHNKFTKIFVNLFGTKTIKIHIEGKVYYANRGSCFNLLNASGASYSKKSEILANLQSCFGSAHGSFNPLEKTLKIEREEKKLNDTIQLFLKNVKNTEQENYFFIMSLLKFVKFLAAEDGIEKMRKAFVQDEVYWYRKADLEIPFGFPYRFSDTWEKSKLDLEKILDDFLNPLYTLDEESIIFELKNLTPYDFNFDNKEKLFLYEVSYGLKSFIKWKRNYLNGNESFSISSTEYLAILNYLDETSGNITPLEELVFNDPIDFTSKKDQILILNHMMRFVIENLSLKDGYADAISVIKFYKFLCEENGMKDIEKNFDVGGLYFFEKPDLEINNSIPFHYHDTWDASKTGLEEVLMIQFLQSYTALISDKQRHEFFSKCNGYCIEAKTSSPIEYAASLQSAGNLPSFITLMQKYELEAKKELENQALSLDLLAGHVNDKHGGSKCLPDKNMCPDGIINLETARIFLGYSNADLS